MIPTSPDPAIAESERDQDSAQRRYQTIFESAGTGLLVVKDGVYTDANPAACRMLARPLEDILGRSPSEFVPPEFEAQQAAARDVMLATGRVQGEFPLTRPDGLWAWLFLDVTYDRETQEMLAVVTDLSELKAAQQTIRDTHDLLTQTTNALPVLISFINKECRYEFANAAYERWFGIPVDQIHGSHVRDVIGEAAFDAAKPHMDSALDGNSVTFERTLPYRTEHRFVRVSYMPRFDHLGQVIGFFTLVADLSDRKAAEDALRETEERATAAMRAGQVGTWHWDIPKNRVEWSDQIYRFHGIDRSGFDGSVEAFTKMVHPDDLPRVQRALEATLHSDAPYKLDFRTIRPDGQVRWLTTEAQVLRDESGAPKTLLGATVDITERKQAEEQLRAASEQFRLLAEASPSFIWMANDEGQFSFISPGWTNYSGLTAERTRAGMADIIHPDDFEIAMAIERRAKEQSTPYSFETRVRSAVTGEYRWFLTQAVPQRTTDGKLLAWLGVTTDIHDRKTEQGRLEHLVQERTAELKFANAEMEGFTYSVSHDLRAPLRAIVATSRMLQEDFSNQLSDDAKTLLVRQAVAASRMAELIDDLLRLSRLSRQGLEKRRLDLTHIAEDLGADISSERGDIRVKVHPALAAHGDPHLVRFLLQNLMENAAKFSPNGGEIEVGSNGAGTFFVRDQGIGFDMQYANKIFMPFERLHRDDEFPGTGIGLASVRRIAERHGGRAWVESQPGQGSTFYFTLG